MACISECAFKCGRPLTETYHTVISNNSTQDLELGSLIFPAKSKVAYHTYCDGNNTDTRIIREYPNDCSVIKHDNNCEIV